jgi:hypothetical protein
MTLLDEARSCKTISKGGLKSQQSLKLVLQRIEHADVRQQVSPFSEKGYVQPAKSKYTEEQYGSR